MLEEIIVSYFSSNISDIVYYETELNAAHCRIRDISMFLNLINIVNKLSSFRGRGVPSWEVEQKVSVKNR